MDHLELKELLKGRIGWDKYPSDFAISLDSENLTSESGRLFNSDEHAFVTLENIYNTMQVENADETTFNAHLKRMRNQVILLVLADVFKVVDIQDDVLDNRLNLFDNAISKRMAIVVGETILTSTQSNRIERINKEQQQRIFFELNGNADSSSSRANQNFPTFIGLKSRYGQEIENLRDTLNQVDTLDVVTMNLPNYINDNNLLYP